MAAALGQVAGELMQDEELDQEILNASADDLKTRVRLLDAEAKVLRSEGQRLTHEKGHMSDKIQENTEKIKLNKQLPYLVGNIVEILDIDEEDEEDGANVDLDSQRKGKAVVLKTSTRQTIFLPVIGLVPAEDLRPSDLVGVNKDSYLVLEKLPAEYDSRVKAMEVDEKPTETYAEVGGLDKQIHNPAVPIAAMIDISTTSTVPIIAIGLAIRISMPTMMTPNASGMMVDMSLMLASLNA